MCGINGIISSKRDVELVNLVSNMNDLIIHRGPDDDGLFFENEQIAMGMRRLSVIDLSSGKQPISNDEKTITIVFNGEIYNYLSLREQLIQKGASFNTNSDTEVVLKGYELYGKDFLNQLDGMFVFSIYDKRTNKILIGRDFFGEKPLYYTKAKQRFIWASELKSIIKVLDEKPNIQFQGLNLYFQLSYIPAPFTIYEGIYKLEANHCLEFDCTNFSFEITEIKHEFEKWDNLSKSQAIKHTHDLVQQSVYSRSVADVPIGSFLSGGVDSSIVSLCLAQQLNRKIETFSLGFDKKSFDETEKSQLVAKLINSNHHQFTISEKDLTQNIDDVILNFDEPFADSSALASYFIAQKTQKSVTVALTGDGGDEVFGGYNKYYMGHINKIYTKWIPQKMHNFLSKGIQNLLVDNQDNRGKKFKINRLLKSINYEGNFYYDIISLGFHEFEMNEVLKKGVQFEGSMDYYKQKIKNRNSTLTDFRNIDKMMSLEGDMIVKVDRTSMLASLECRAPFLNKELWNFSNQLPEKYLMKAWDKKHILKEAFKEYFPANFLDKSKKGFGVPVGDWLKMGLKAELLSYVDRKFIEKQNIFEYDKIKNLVDNHLNNKIDNTFKLWVFYCFQKWYKNNYEQ